MVSESYSGSPVGRLVLCEKGEYIKAYLDQVLASAETKYSRDLVARSKHLA